MSCYHKFKTVKKYAYLLVPETALLARLNRFESSYNLLAVKKCSKCGAVKIKKPLLLNKISHFGAGLRNIEIIPCFYAEYLLTNKP